MTKSTYRSTSLHGKVSAVNFLSPFRNPALLNEHETFPIAFAFLDTPFRERFSQTDPRSLSRARVQAS